MQDGQLSRAFISSLLAFFRICRPPASPWSPKKKKNYEEKPNASIFDFCMCLFLYLFYSLCARRLPSCAFGCLSVPL